MSIPETYESTLAHVKTHSSPSELRITDIRFADIAGAPMHCSLIKVFTNQGLVGFGEVRDGADKQYALMLKSRLLGENPCQIDKLFRRIKQFGGHARQGGGVSGLEIALWDLAGKAYGIPIYQMLGGKFRDRIRMYCDTDVNGKDTGTHMGLALKERMDKGFTFLKMDLGINQIIHEPGTLSAPLGFLEEMRSLSKAWHDGQRDGSLSEAELRRSRNRLYDIYNIAHPFTGIHVTEKGLDMLEQYVAEVRAVIGYEVPLAIDHFGHIGIEDCIKLGKRIDKFNLAWMEDMIPWQYTEQYVRLSRSVTTPVCTGEDIYLKENFRPLLASGGVSVIHPDVLTAGGILETKKIGDMAQDYGVSMAIHMAESPIACLAAVHAAAATENFLALEYHSVDVDWWDDLIVSKLPKPLVDKGFIAVPDAPGLGIEELNDETIAEHLHPRIPGLWEATDSWNDHWGHDRLWS
ncbi:mandelate racemase/muconate lactonizing enzyme family protein [Cohnella thailandensis]|uniref:Mandelate racemase/muconate lactonizing enzyme family protein n=1 Tax=Cohnella thailandensis TaxID=557557 RepID=A0A841T0J0_9BACL|nr:mandelate racemase/muconate lactonizing enzyme family protein [Cohnella thailandensis]MBB6636599.1 mandelate racemase/muconate lactonizing enzyme family protein [Cohnella thailandensis]MBP1973527.1 L-alanine-DL-glutamate epimerase-like enolase superfamily enzyme [Cohnella thailandensis]